MLLRKFNISFLAVALLFVTITGGCTKVNEVIVPPPDFEKIIKETKTFVGAKLHDTNPLRSVTDGYVLEVIGEGDKIFFQEKREEYNSKGELTEVVYKYEVQFDVAKYKNAITFTIPAQIVNGTKVRGIAYSKEETAHGYYKLETVDGEPDNSLSFRLSTGSSNWSYILEAKQ